MALFHPGQMLVYGNVGVCQVEAVGTPKFLRGESREYYTLTPVYSKHKEKIYLPTGTAAYLRPPVTPQQGEAYLAEMPALEVRTSRYLKQALLAQHYQELLQSHCVPDYLRLFKEISCKERQRKNSGKKLNLMDKDYYATAEKLLSEEFALALQTTPDAMREQLHTAALA